jgi:hypothetical protein
MTRRLLVMAFLGTGLSACSMMDLSRSDASGYASNDPSTAREFYADQRKEKWNEARDDLGIPQGQELSDEEAQAIRNRVELSRLEHGLQYDQERKQYYGLKPYFHDDGERIYFLKLPTREARDRWAHHKGITTDETKVDQITSGLIENNDIGRGMTRGAVKQSWGEPDLVESAGNPMYGNERWRYTKQVSTDDGYKQEMRIIYFESGRVVGWETLQ